MELLSLKKIPLLLVWLFLGSVSFVSFTGVAHATCSSTSSGTYACAAAGPYSGTFTYTYETCDGLNTWLYTNAASTCYCSSGSGYYYPNDCSTCPSGKTMVSGSCVAAPVCTQVAGIASCTQDLTQYGVPASYTSGTASYTYNSCTGAVTYTGGCYYTATCANGGLSGASCPTGYWTSAPSCPTACGTGASTTYGTCTGGNGWCSGSLPIRSCSATAACYVAPTCANGGLSGASCPTGYWTSAPSCPTACGTGASTTYGTCTGGNGYCSGSAPTLSCSATAACYVAPVCTQITGSPVSCNQNLTMYGVPASYIMGNFSYIYDSCTGAVTYTGGCSPPPPIPTVSLTASPSSVAYNGQSILTWSSSNATSCTASGPWSNSGTLSGSGWSNPLTTNTTFYFQCRGPGGMSALQSVTVTVSGATPVMSGSLSITPSPCIIGVYESSCHISLSWVVTNPEGKTSFTSSNPGGLNYDGSADPASFNTVMPVVGEHNPTSFSLYNNSKLLAQTDVIVKCTAGTIWAGGVCMPPPTASLTASPASVAYGSRATLTWSSGNAPGIVSNATSCTAGGPWSNASSPFGPGSGLTDPLYANTTFTFQCTGPGGTSALQSVTVTVAAAPAPTASLTASPNPVAYGAQSTLTWSSSNATSGAASGPWSNLTPPTGNSLNGSGLTNPLYANTTFTFQSTGSGGTSALQSQTVTVGAAPAAACPSTTVSGCDLSSTSSGGSSGSCSSGYVGACSYSCSNGAWSMNSNSCAKPADCYLDGTTIISGYQVTASKSRSATSPATCTSEIRYCTNSSLSGTYPYVGCTQLTPTINSFTVAPMKVRQGGGTVVAIKWSTTDVTSCVVKRSGSTQTWSGTSSSGISDTVNVQTIYTITCDALAPQTVTVNVVPSYGEF